MNIEQTLTDELRVVAAAVQPPPPPDVAALVRQAARTRGRTRLRWTTTTVLAAAAVIAAIVLGNQIGRPDAAPSPTKPTPTRTADRLPVGSPLRTYVELTTGKLYIDGTPESGFWNDASTVDGLTLAFGRTTNASGDADVGVFRGGQRVGTLPHVSDHVVETSPGTRAVAWVENHDTTGVIVVAQVSKDGVHELGRLSVPELVLGGDNESDENLISVADDGTVTYGGILSGHSWRPGSAPKVADISSYEYGPQGYPPRAEDVRPNHSGTWGAWLTDERDPGTGGGYASWGAVAFQQPGHPETKVKVTLPANDNDIRDLYWESDTDLILRTSYGDASADAVKDYVRCSVTDGRCEVAPGP
ncbi:MAG: hypothetical protein JF565_02570 [Propionibacteriales bacterium]|nr:hypothetical protein [Propionibacteriales bacterium]